MKHPPVADRATSRYRFTHLFTAPRELHNDDLPNRLAARQAIEAFVDLTQLQVFAQQCLDRQMALLVHRDKARNVAGGDAGADITALHGALFGNQTDGL